VRTPALGERCNHALAVDIAEGPLPEGRIRCERQPGVAFEKMAVPQDWLAGTFDLLLFSEVLCCLGILGLPEAARRTMECLLPRGVVVMVNCRGATDGACTGEAAAEMFMADVEASMTVVSTRREERCRLGVLRSRTR